MMMIVNQTKLRANQECKCIFIFLHIFSNFGRVSKVDRSSDFFYSTVIDLSKSINLEPMILGVAFEWENSSLGHFHKIK